MLKMTHYSHYLFTACVIVTLVPSSFAAIDQQLARSYFAEAQVACTADSGKLWGISLCVPMMFIDPQTRECVANQADSAGLLKSEDGLFVGSWPESYPIANSTKDWEGTHWTTVVWPPPTGLTSRRVLLMHESYHNIEKTLGFPTNMVSNPQLGKKDGRIWLRLEWAALMSALKSDSTRRLNAIEDALTFRAYRHHLFQESAETERQMEMHEGLAEYTGTRLSGLSPTSAAYYVADTAFPARVKNPSYESSFAYTSGPAYGLLLDAISPNWRSNLDPNDDLASLLQSALNITLPANLAESAEKHMLLYNGTEVRSEEDAREQEHLKMVAAYRDKLVQGPVLVIPLQKMNLQYDPRNIETLEGIGTVYPTISIADDWGTLAVTQGGALISSTWTSVKVSAPKESNPSSCSGDGWTLKLAAGWKVTPGDRTGDFTLTRSK